MVVTMGIHIIMSKSQRKAVIVGRSQTKNLEISRPDPRYAHCSTAPYVESSVCLCNSSAPFYLFSFFLKKIQIWIDIYLWKHETLLVCKIHTLLSFCIVNGPIYYRDLPVDSPFWILENCLSKLKMYLTDVDVSTNFGGI